DGDASQTGLERATKPSAVSPKIYFFFSFFFSFSTRICTENADSEEKKAGGRGKRKEEGGSTHLSSFAGMAYVTHDGSASVSTTPIVGMEARPHSRSRV